MQVDALTRKSSLLAMLLLLILGVATLVRTQLLPYGAEVAVSPFFERTASYVVALLITLAGGLVMGRVFLQSGLSKGFCTLPIPIYGVLLCGIFVSPNLLEYVLSSFCFAFAVQLLMRSLNYPDEKNSIFFGSIFLGIVPLLLPQGAVMVVILPVMVLLFALSLRQVVIMVAGYALPLLFASYFSWYIGGDILSVAEWIWQGIVTPKAELFSSIPIVACVLVGYISLLLLVGGIYLLIKGDKMFLLSRVKRALHIMIFIFAVMVATLALPSADISLLAIIAVPTTVLLSLILSLLPRGISTLAYWALLALTILHLFIE